MPEPPGPRQGHAGAGPPLRLLILGDSSAAGVGAAHQDQALAGRLCAHLSDHVRLDWRLAARSGATTATALRMLDALGPASFDAAVIALGVNDVKNGLSAARWMRNYRALVDRLDTGFGTTTICASGVPPLQHFPLLPSPLRDVLGARAGRFDAILRDIAADTPGLHHIPFDLDLGPHLMAADGFHPGPRAYDAWAQQLVPHLAP